MSQVEIQTPESHLDRDLERARRGGRIVDVDDGQAVALLRGVA